MKTRTALSLAIVLLACLVRPALADTQTELKALEETRRAAIKSQDFEALGRIYSPDFLAVTADGKFMTRSELFDVFRKSGATLTFETDQVRIVSSGNTAVFFGRLVAKMADGKTAFSSRFSNVYVKRSGAWICIAGQSTALP